MCRLAPAQRWAVHPVTRLRGAGPIARHGLPPPGAPRPRPAAAWHAPVVWQMRRCRQRPGHRAGGPGPAACTRGRPEGRPPAACL